MTGAEWGIVVSGSRSQPVVSAVGELDHVTGPTLTRKIRAILDGRPARLCLDLSGVAFFASGSLSVLIAAHEAAASAGTDLVPVSVPANLRRLLEIAGVHDLFQIEPPTPTGR